MSTIPTSLAPRTSRTVHSLRNLAVGLAIAASVSSCAAPVETGATEATPAIAAADEVEESVSAVDDPTVAVTDDQPAEPVSSDELAFDHEEPLNDVWVSDDGPDYPEEYSEPAVFYDPWLALGHAGPWADHQVGRCLDWPRTTGALYTDVQIGGGLSTDGPLESYVAQSAMFADDATAQAAFNDIDWCYITESIVQFAEALGWYGYDAAFSSNEWTENFDGEQTLFVEFDHWDLPITLVAIQRDRRVSVAISYDGWAEGTYLAAADLLA